MSAEHHIFVDFENVREADLNLLAGRPATVTLVLGRQQNSLPLNLVEALRRLPPAQVELVQSQVQGRNSLDFVLACLVGAAVERRPGVQVQVVSKDKGFDALVAHLQSRGTPASRHDSLAAAVLAGRAGKGGAGGRAARAQAAVVPDGAVEGRPYPRLQDRIELVAARLAKSNSSRPKKKTTLLSHIAAQFGKKLADDELEQTFAGLVERGVVKVDLLGHLEYVD